MYQFVLCQPVTARLALSLQFAKGLLNGTERTQRHHVNRPEAPYESNVVHLDRNELGAILVTAGLSSPRDHALVSLLALNGLRVSKAIGADLAALGLERGHRTLTSSARAARPPPCHSRHASPERSISP